ncbi:putative terminase large subunit, partial [Escherichia coli EC1850]
HCV